MKIIFVINTLTHHHLMFDYIKKLNEMGGYEVHSILVNSQLLAKEENLLKYSKVTKLYQSKINKENTTRTVKKKGKSIFFYWMYFFYLFQKHFKIIKKCNAIIDSIHPDFVFVSSDRYTDFDLFFAKCCRKKNIKVGVLGIDFSLVETFEAYLKQNQTRKVTTTFQKIISKLLPNQVFKVNGDRCIFYPAHLTLNLFLMNALPSRPYLTGSRFVNQIHVDCEATKQKYIEYGIDQKLVKSVGLLEHDLISLTCPNKDDIKNQFNLDPTKKIVVLAVPQGLEHDFVGEKEHFEIIENIIKSILNHDVNLILSLHPKMNLDNYSYLEKKFHLQISKLFLRDFIVISDLYIATYSSTVLWSSILNLPCLVFDLHNLNLSIYRELENVTIATGFSEFENKLDLVFYEINVNSSAKSYNSKYGVLDNNVFTRFLENINET